MCQHPADRPARAVALEDGCAHDHDHEAWTRRDFLVRAGLGGVGGALLFNAPPTRALGRTPLLDALASLETDRVLVLVQLAGGNDGLNTVVPVTNDLYYQRRPTIGVAANAAIPLSTDFGWHPSLAPLQSRWGSGDVAVVHGVGYPSPDLSHFRGTDIWVTSSDGTRPVPATGWGGRSVEALYPTVDAEPPNDPPAVQIGASGPLLFAGAAGRRAVTLTDPALINQIALDGTLYDPAAVPPTRAGQELGFVRTVANEAFRYLGGMRDAANRATNTATYPANAFGASLAAAARFIKGRLNTRIYHVLLDGFDTHSSQGTRHPQLLASLAGAVDAFFADLAQTGDAERVLAMTFSEFGRRVAENGSGGTDHGTAAPLFLFGPAALGGLHGAPPDLGALDASGNLRFTTDFRQVYATTLRSWFGLDEGTTTAVLGGAFEPLPLLAVPVPSEPAAPPLVLELGAPFPNPTRDAATVAFALDVGGEARVEAYDVAGRLVSVLHDGPLAPGRHTARFEGADLPAGLYVLRLLAPNGARTQRVTVVR